MGITPLHAEFLILEHNRPLPEVVHLLGRQTVVLGIDHDIALIRSHGLEPHNVNLEIDRQTHGAHAAGQDFISDRTFFGLLGVKKVLAIDYTDYEGAEVILDLNKPVPDAYEGSMDFIVGGSVLDNIFDPATYIKNTSRLLRPGGRLFDQNILSQHHHPYCLVTPAWVHDYFVVNRYASCMVYIGEYAASGFVHLYRLAPSADDFMSDFGPPRGGLPIGFVVIAEKGPQLTWQLVPIQDQYRSEEDSVRYRDHLSDMMEARPIGGFRAPSAADLARLGIRASKSYRYLGVVGGAAGTAGWPSVELATTGAASGLRILEATYGGNCLANPPDRSAVCAVYRGNATDILASLANGLDRWQWVVSVHTLGGSRPRPGKGPGSLLRSRLRSGAATATRLRSGRGFRGGVGAFLALKSLIVCRAAKAPTAIILHVENRMNENNTPFSTTKLVFIAALPKSASSLAWLIVSALQEESWRANPDRQRGTLAHPFLQLTWDVLDRFPEGGTYKSHAPVGGMTEGVLRLLGCKHVVLLRHPADFIPALYCHIRAELTKKGFRANDGRSTRALGQLAGSRIDQAVSNQRPPAPWIHAISPVRHSVFAPGVPLDDAIAHFIADGPLLKAMEWMADWLQYRDPDRSIVVTYEELMDHFDTAVDRLSRFIRGVPPTSDVLAYLNHVVRAVGEEGRAKPETHYSRGWTGAVGIWSNYLSDDNVRLYNATVEKFLAYYPHASQLSSIYPNLVLSLEPPSDQEHMRIE